MLGEKISYAWSASGHVEVKTRVGDAHNGLTNMFTFKANNTTNAITFTLSLYDVEGNLIWQQTGILENAFTVIPIERPILPGFQVGVDPSGDAGASGAAIEVVVYSIRV